MTPDELSVAAEQSVLGACMYERANIADAAAVVKADDFWRPNHGELFTVMLQLHAEGMMADPVILLERLSKSKRLAGVGGAPYLHTLYSLACPASAIGEYARIIADAATYRRVRAAGLRIQQAADEGQMDPASLMQWSGEQLAAARDERQGVELLTLPWEDFIHSTPGPGEMVVPGLLGQADRLVLTGHGGLGKSTLLQQFAVCAAGGVPPFDWMSDDCYDPVRVSILDCENPGFRVKTRLWPMVRDVAEIGQDPRPNLSIMEDCGRALDLLNPQTALSVLRTIERDKPGIVYIGPVYKLHNADPDKEETGKRITAVLDAIRALGACVITEAHHTKEGRSGGSLAPSGTNLWTWWPEFGMGLRLSAESDAEMMRRCNMERWRIDRESSQWPDLIETSGKLGMPWVRAAGGPAMTRDEPPIPKGRPDGAPF